jgi:hypothetical protein
VGTLSQHGLEARFGAELLRWEGRDPGAPDRSLWNVNLMPSLRWRPAEGAWHGTFAEIGVGFDGLSATGIGVSSDFLREFSTAFQFGERASAGWIFGPGDRYEIAVLVQHVSNGKINEPNDGLTYFGVNFRIPLKLE